MAKKKGKMVTLRLPQKAWNLLAETLAMDAESGAFDPALRREILKALEKVQDAGEPYVLVGLYGGVPSRTEVFWSEAGAIKAAKEEAKSLREEEDIVIVNHGTERIYSWPAEKE